MTDTRSNQAAALFTRYAAYAVARNAADKRTLRATLDELCVKAARAYVGTGTYAPFVFTVVRAVCDDIGPIPEDSAAFGKYRDNAVPRIEAALDQVRNM